MWTRLALRYCATMRDSGHWTAQTTRRNRLTLLSFTTEVDHLQRWDRRHVDRWLERPGLSAATRRSRISTLRGWCRWLVERGDLRTDPTAHVKAPRVPKGAPRWHTVDEVRMLMTHAKDERELLMLSLMVQEGLRCVEVARLRVEDVDRDGGWISVRGKGGRGVVTREVPLTDESRRALDRLLRAEPASLSDHVIRSRTTGEALTSGTISRMARRVWDRAGMKGSPWDGRSAHALRHTCAQHVLDGGADVRQVQALLGHSSLATTEGYLRRRPTGLDVAVAGRVYS
jgi:integrase/recombinase XerC